MSNTIFGSNLQEEIAELRAILQLPTAERIAAFENRLKKDKIEIEKAVQRRVEELELLLSKT